MSNMSNIEPSPKDEKQNKTGSNSPISRESYELTFTEIVKEGKSLGVEIPPEIVSKCVDLAHHLALASRTHNLTRMTAPEPMTIGMFLDSFVFLRHIDGAIDGTIVDVGSGAGFPALPLALALPSCQLTALECRKMKSDYVRDVGKLLAINNLTSLHSRAEDCKTKFRVAVARALGRPRRSLELLLHLIRPGGKVILACGRAAAERANFSGLKVRTSLHPYRLPNYRNDFAHIVATPL